MLSRPKNPPEKTFFPSGSFLFTHLQAERGVRGQGMSAAVSKEPGYQGMLLACKHHSPVEVEDKFLERSSEEWNVPLSTRSGHLEDAEAGPRMDWGIDIRELELISRYLSIGSHVPLPEEEEELALGKLRIQFGKGDHVECQIPGCILCIGYTGRRVRRRRRRRRRVICY